MIFDAQPLLVFLAMAIINFYSLDVTFLKAPDTPDKIAIRTNGIICV